MKYMGLLMAALFSATNSGPTIAEDWPFKAAPAKMVTTRQLADTPKDFIGQQIKVGLFGCVDRGGAGFICLSIANGQAIRITAGALGAATFQSVAESLIRECKGTANIARRECQFEAHIKPMSAVRDMMATDDGTMPIVIIYSNQIDLFRRN